MSIDKIQSNKIIQLQYKIGENNGEKLADKDAFDKELKKAQGQSRPSEPTEKAKDTQKILPIQTNYHVLSQVRSTYSQEQLAHDAWNFIFTGKLPNSLNHNNKTEFALKAAEFNMLTRGI